MEDDISYGLENTSRLPIIIDGETEEDIDDDDVEDEEKSTNVLPEKRVTFETNT